MASIFSAAVFARFSICCVGSRAVFSEFVLGYCKHTKIMGRNNPCFNIIYIYIGRDKLKCTQVALNQLQLDRPIATRREPIAT
jgi:hypothetical protein